MINVRKEHFVLQSKTGSAHNGPCFQEEEEGEEKELRSDPGRHDERGRPVIIRFHLAVS
jgi:hypothetical protein